MRIDVKYAKKHPGERFPFEGSLQPPADLFYGDVAVTPPEYSGEYCSEEGGVFTAGSARVLLQTVCDRCGAPMTYEAAAQLNDRFLPEGSPVGDGEDYTYGEDGVDLEAYVREKLLLALPVKRLCKEDCKGLCPRCGHNLNAGPCGCGNIREDNPFSILKDR